MNQNVTLAESSDLLESPLVHRVNIWTEPGPLILHVSRLYAKLTYSATHRIEWPQNCSTVFNLNTSCYSFKALFHLSTTFCFISFTGLCKNTKCLNHYYTIVPKLRPCLMVTLWGKKAVSMVEDFLYFIKKIAKRKEYSTSIYTDSSRLMLPQI